MALPVNSFYKNIITHGLLYMMSWSLG